MHFNNALNHVDNVLNEIKDSLEVVLVAHVLAPRGHDNVLQINCSETEHFTTQEFSEIYQGIVDAGFFVKKIFFNELDFIRDAIANPTEYVMNAVFNLCRNGTGMNTKAVIPAICDLLRIAYTSPSAGSCALARNKKLFTAYLDANGISCPVTGTSSMDFDKHLSMNSLVIRKPNNGSASQGVDEKSILPLSDVEFCGDYLIQEYIDGYECEVPIFSVFGKCFAMPPVGISFQSGEKTGILSYDAAKISDYGFYNLSDVISGDICEKMMFDAEKVFNLLHLDTYGRVDFRIDKNTHRHYLMDISTTPYITKHSSFAFAVVQSGAKYSDLYRLIISASSFRHNERN